MEELFICVQGAAPARPWVSIGIAALATSAVCCLRPALLAIPLLLWLGVAFDVLTEARRAGAPVARYRGLPLSRPAVGVR
jgi:hypothetical protein